MEKVLRRFSTHTIARPPDEDSVSVVESPTLSPGAFCRFLKRGVKRKKFYYKVSVLTQVKRVSFIVNTQVKWWKNACKRVEINVISVVTNRLPQHTLLTPSHERRQRPETSTCHDPGESHSPPLHFICMLRLLVVPNNSFRRRSADWSRNVL